MQPICQELLEVLQKQKEKYQQLMDLSQQKRQSLIKGDLAELNEITQGEESLIFALGKLENEREQCFQQLALVANLAENASLKEVLTVLPLEHQRDLAQVQEEFARLIAQLTHLNQENMGLLEQSLQFVNFTVEAISEQSQPLYNEEREVKVAQLRNILDKKV